MPLQSTGGSLRTPGYAKPLTRLWGSLLLTLKRHLFVISFPVLAPIKSYEF